MSIFVTGFSLVNWCVALLCSSKCKGLIYIRECLQMAAEQHVSYVCRAQKLLAVLDSEAENLYFARSMRQLAANQMVRPS